MANVLNTRLRLKYDALSEWAKVENTFIPLQGEVCIIDVPAQTDAGGNVIHSPAVLFKVGDGTSTFANLPYVSALAGDVPAWAKRIKKADGETDIAADAFATALADIENLKAFFESEDGSGETVNILDKLTQLETTVGVHTETLADYKTRIEALEAIDHNAYSAADTALKTELQQEIDADVKVVADDLAGYKTTANAALADRYTKGEVDAKFAGYNTTAVQKTIDDAQDARIKAIEDTYLDADDIANFETKENVKKVADDLAEYIESNNEALAGVKDTADKAAVKTEVESALALKADKSVVEAMYTNDAIDSKISTAKEEAISAAKTELDGITLAIEEYNDVESIVIKDSKGAVIADVSAATFVKDGMLTDAQYNTDTNKIILTWNIDSGKTTTEVDLNDLVDTYTGGKGVTVATNGEISIDETVIVTRDYLNETVNTLVGTVDDTADTASIAGAKKYAEAQVAAEANARDTAITTAKSEAATDATTKANAAETNAKTYADELAVNYATAAQGALADTALQEVKAVADGGLKVTNKNEIAIDDSVTFILYGGSASVLIENAPTVTE